MINYECVTKENITEHNPNWLQTLEHSYRILIIGPSGSGQQQNNHVQIKQNINIFKKNPEKLILNTIKIQRFILNIQIIRRISAKILKSKSQIENVKY